MKITISTVGPSRFWRAATSFSLLTLSVLFFGSTLVAGKIAEPGLEADGVYSCGKEVSGKFVELGKLELKGRTYRTFSPGDTLPKEKKEFYSFTTDGKGRLQWSASFGFLSHSTHMAGGTSTYSLDDTGNPSILINYSDNHAPTFMICSKEK